jgi:anti-sigma factor RsiW
MSPMSSSCAQWRGEIGAFIVGALDGDARDQVTRHLETCTGCRSDYEELVPVRECLSLLVATVGEVPVKRAGRPRCPG